MDAGTAEDLKSGMPPGFEEINMNDISQLACPFIFD
jgi:hypothetical protein